ncbi:hypothetical protein R70006_07655 [Paraburkholderia domus]|nr:hypothetical protein R70006_07655 [Paraburkholderia domus]CAE6966169.1 hypothetical protein R75471_07030 [Paraburkholderia domus]
MTLVEYGVRHRRRQHGKDTSDNAVNLKIGGSIERIEKQQIFRGIRGMLMPAHLNRLELFRCQSAQTTNRLDRTDHNVVGNDVEFLLRLSMDILGMSNSGCAVEYASLNSRCDGGACVGNRFDQRNQSCRDSFVKCCFRKK